uniref:PorP/SprF family type IX secretion system membrane protein n=1 Tax=uncultured Draconibacterium sp. TaxID=1573823 RepID=UPI0032173DDF
MKQLKTLLITLVVFAAHTTSAQDFPYHYFIHTTPLIANPSLAAIDHKIAVEATTYNLWSAGQKPLNDNIISFSFNPSGKFKARTRYAPSIGIGLVLSNENIGPFSQNILQLIYAYHIPLNRDLKLSLGICGLIEAMEVNINSLSPQQENDPRLSTGNNYAVGFDGGFGATLKSKSYSFSFSSLNLAPTNFDFDESLIKEIKNFRKYYLTGKYDIKLNRKIHFTPQITLRNSRYQDFSFDTACSVNFTYFQTGAGYRNEKTLFAYLKIFYKNFEFTYTSENPMKANYMSGNGHTFSLSWHQKSTDYF